MKVIDLRSDVIDTGVFDCIASFAPIFEYGRGVAVHLDKAAQSYKMAVENAANVGLRRLFQIFCWMCLIR